MFQIIKEIIKTNTVNDITLLLKIRDYKRL